MSNYRRKVLCISSHFSFLHLSKSLPIYSYTICIEFEIFLVFYVFIIIQKLICISLQSKFQMRWYFIKNTIIQLPKGTFLIVCRASQLITADTKSVLQCRLSSFSFRTISFPKTRNLKFIILLIGNNSSVFYVQTTN